MIDDEEVGEETVEPIQAPVTTPEEASAPEPTDPRYLRNVRAVLGDIVSARQRIEHELPTIEAQCQEAESLSLPQVLKDRLALVVADVRSKKTHRTGLLVALGEIERELKTKPESYL